jgi:hypothetical protein
MIGGMGIGVHVTEYSGAVVATLDSLAPGDINRLCALAAADPTRYPLLSGVDEYDDTVFNPRQSLQLARELHTLAPAGGDGLRLTIQAVLQLIDLLQPAPGRPHHRRLVFSGD